MSSPPSSTSKSSSTSAAAAAAAAASSSPSPPRKRIRSSSSSSSVMIGEGPNAVTNSRNNDSANSSSPDSGRRNSHNSAKMKLKGRRHSSGGRYGPGSSNRGGSCPSQGFIFDEKEEFGFEGEYPIREIDQQEMLLKKVAQRTDLNLQKTDQEIVRLIGQHLTKIGLKFSANVLMKEAGCKLDQPSAAYFKRQVMSGHWGSAVRALDDLRDHLDNPSNFVEMKFLLLEQKFLEFLAQKNRMEACRVLQAELTPLGHKQTRIHELSSFLMLSKPEDINRVTMSARPTDRDRHELMERLQSFLPASIMLPPRRLETLLTQAAEHQVGKCLFHNKSGPVDLDVSYLAVDHQCSKENFPYETMQVLSDHCEEVWYCKFSPNGLLLATGSKDMTVIIWGFDPDSLSLKQLKTLDRHGHGVACFAWSPDSKKLAVCGVDESEEICIWNVERGEVEAKISHATDDALTTVAWSPDGKKLACGGAKGNFYQCDTNGVVNDSWEGVRVQCLQYRKDGKSILASDTHHRIRSYNFEELRDSSILQEDHGIMNFTLDQSDTFALVSIANQGIHLWNIDERCLVRKFTGITQGFYTIYSCFGGGPAQNYVASGSEDTKVYIYHIKQDKPIAVLSGHTRTVNCVDWNPVYPNVLVSASDDSSVRVWGPSLKYRHKQRELSSVNGQECSSSHNTETLENGGEQKNHCNTANGVS